MNKSVIALPFFFFFADIYCLLDFAAFTAFSIIASETVTVPH